ncbi:MAG: MFS transporter [Spirochaetes bacterium]|nr:MFS transporter [Spirochaetota bacterium]
MKSFPPIYYYTALANFLFFLANSFFILFPLYLKDLGASESYIGLMNSIDKVFVVFGSFFIGTIIHQFNRIKFLRFGYAILCVAFFLYLFIHSISILIPFVRIIHGIGFTIAMIVGTTIVFESVSVHRSTEAIGLFGVTGALANALSPFFGEFLLSKGITHHTIYCISVILIFIAFAITFFMVRLHPEFHNENNVQFEGIFRLFKDAHYRLYALASFVFGGGFGIIITFLPNFVRRNTDLNFSIFFVVYISILIVIRFTALRSIERAEKKNLIAAIFVIGAIMNIMVNWMHSLFMLTFVGILYGITHGVLYPVLNAHLVNLVANSDRGKSNAIFTALFNGGMMVFSFTGGFIIDYMNSYIAAFNFSALMFIIIAFAVAIVGNSKG